MPNENQSLYAYKKNIEPELLKMTSLNDKNLICKHHYKYLGIKHQYQYKYFGFTLTSTKTDDNNNFQP